MQDQDREQKEQELADLQDRLEELQAKDKVWKQTEQGLALWCMISMVGMFLSGIYGEESQRTPLILSAAASLVAASLSACCVMNHRERKHTEISRVKVAIEDAEKFILRRNFGRTNVDSKSAPTRSSIELVSVLEESKVAVSQVGVDPEEQDEQDEQEKQDSPLLSSQSRRHSF